MAKTKKKKMTEEQRVIAMLKAKGYTEITQEDKQQSWYQEHLKQLERWREEEVGKPFTVRERQALYGSKRTTAKKSS